MKRYLVCISGASGAPYAIRLLSALAAEGDAIEIHVVATDWGERLVLEETGQPLSDHLAAIGRGAIIRHSNTDLAAPVASGSFRLDGTIIVPCSMGTAGAIASGLSANLVQRAAAVALKEEWPLVLVPRETPMSLPNLRSLVALKEAGATIMPACPGFYNRPVSIEELIDQIAHRVMDRLGLAAPDALRWIGGDGLKGEEEE